MRILLSLATISTCLIGLWPHASAAQNILTTNEQYIAETKKHHIISIKELSVDSRKITLQKPTPTDQRANKHTSSLKISAAKQVKQEEFIVNCDPLGQPVTIRDINEKTDLVVPLTKEEILRRQKIAELTCLEPATPIKPKE